MGAVAELADRVARHVRGPSRRGRAEGDLHDPQHPYTWGLLGSIPRVDRSASAGWRPSPARRPRCSTYRGLSIRAALPVPLRALREHRPELCRTRCSRQARPLPSRPSRSATRASSSVRSDARAAKAGTLSDAAQRPALLEVDRPRQALPRSSAGSDRPRRPGRARRRRGLLAVERARRWGWSASRGAASRPLGRSAPAAASSRRRARSCSTGGHRAALEAAVAAAAPARCR